MSRVAIGFVGLLVAVSACSSGGKANPGGGTPGTGGGTPGTGGATPGTGVGGADAGGAADAGPLAWQAEPPAVYLAKVKNLLVGLPP
ncbi:MAG TPA: hypothetical protein VKZ18_27905, partial [Polyangia bacterium]|nr:hypothetical protein [Polyangia bacterium]